MTILVNTIKKWRAAFRKNGKLNKNGRPSNSKDKSELPKWERKKEWKDLSTDILAAANAQYLQKGCVTLQFVSAMTGKSVTRVSRILRRFKWNFYLYNYSVYLTDDQKKRRMAMAQAFENKIAQNPEYLRQIWWSDESYFVVGLRKPGRCGTFLAPCDCLRATEGRQNPCTCEHRRKRNIPVSKNPEKVSEMVPKRFHIILVCEK